MKDNRKLFHLFNQKARLLNKELNDRLKHHGLYHSQWSILFCLRSNGPMTQTDIWQYLNVEAPTVTRTLKRMEENGWIIRKPGRDKRERLIYLSDSAISNYEEIEKTVQQFEADMIGNFSATERNQLLSLLEKF